VPDLDFSLLRRWPDVETPELVAVDATDHFVLDEAKEAVVAHPHDVVVIGDHHGALTLGTVVEHGARGVRVHQDALTGERALDANAERLGVEPAWTHHDLDVSLVQGARVVLLQLPRSLDALDEIAGLIARHAHPDVVVVAGGRVKHMTLTMNDVLRTHFSSVVPSLARRKSRLLVSTGPLQEAVAASWPRRALDEATGLTVVAHGAAFAGSRVDIGTRQLVAVLDQAVPDAVDVVDLGCGTGVLAAAVARARASVRVVATDHSAVAVASAAATAEANGVADRVSVVRADSGDALPEASADLVLLNPPFHSGAAVVDDLAWSLFAAAARLLRPGGEVWVVFNSHLGHRAALERFVGPTRQVSRSPKFTVVAATRR
jgi:16S rRNA (guanine1207-N2)-methyltransferase